MSWTDAETTIKKKRLDNDDVINVTVLEIVEINPHISQRQIICELNISAKTVCRILRANSYHLYHITSPSTFDNDKKLRIRFCRWIQEQIALDLTFFNRVMLSDEATFQNTGELNWHNCHYYSPL